MHKYFFQILRAHWYDYFLRSHGLALPRVFYETEHPDKKINKEGGSFETYRRLLASYVKTLSVIRGESVACRQLFQEIRLRRIIKTAARSVWWRNRFKKLGINPRSIRSFEDLAKLPPVARAELKEVPIDNLTTRKEDEERVQTNSTAGTTTGVPFRIRFDRSVALLNVAAHYQWIMERRGVPVQTLSNRNFILALNMFGGERPVSTIPEQFVEYQTLNRASVDEAQLDSFLETASQMGAFVLFTHPSELFYLVQRLKERKVRINVRLCLVIGQALDPAVRKIAQDYFGAAVVSVFGLREYMLSGEECPARQNAFHLQGERIHLEILDDEGERVDEGVFGNATFTGLDNTLMPLIRYQSGDRARLIGDPCSCGNPYQLFELEHRTNDLFEFTNGRTMGIKAVSKVLMMEPFVSSIARYQIRQERSDLIRILIVTTGQADKDALVTDLSGPVREAIQAPSDTSVVVDIVDLIQSEGKYKPFVSLAAFRASSQRSEASP